MFQVPGAEIGRAISLNPVQSACVRTEGTNSDPEAHWGIFATTHWSVVLAAGQQDTRESAFALEQLCRTYWLPIYGYIRRRGYAPEQAQDYTQELFARLLRKNSFAAADPEKGRFRSFLLGALKHLLADEKDRAKAAKRGDGRPLLGWEELAAEERLRAEPLDQFSPDRVFDRRWAMTILEQATRKLKDEHQAPDRRRLFENLKPYLGGGEVAPSYAQTAARLGLTESAAKAAVFRIRQRYHLLVREEVAQTVTNPRDLEEEIHYLISLFSASATG
jgi:RNA polymerase sigma-70 factor (ECF subfamily)